MVGFKVAPKVQRNNIYRAKSNFKNSENETIFQLTSEFFIPNKQIT